MKKRIHRSIRAVLAALILLTISLGAADYAIDDSISVRTGAVPDAPLLCTVSLSGESVQTSTATASRCYAQLFGVLPLKEVKLQYVDNLRLCPGGMPFGAKMFTEGLIVVGFTDVDCTSGSKQPAYDAGIRVKDIILSINGTPVTSAEKMAEAVGSCDGSPLTVRLLREEQPMTVTVIPSFSESEQQYKTGMWVRDNTAGIGTVTYVDPKTGAFAGLGHGICDAETGTLLPLSRGIIVDVTITGIQKGVSGIPGELKGRFSSGRHGSLLGNSDTGVFGVFTSLPDNTSAENTVPIALKNEIRDGKATIYCTLDENGIQSYEVNIRKIKNSMDNKNMEITVTDPILLEKTGGIVQGMSGSPIIQNGKLVGAVTHVLISDPAKGYGIFIENMLDAAG